MLDNEFEGKAIEYMTEDIKGFIGAMGVMVTFGLEEFTYPKFEKIIIYPHPFPSPNNKNLHSSEIETEDGCMIFARPAVVNALQKSAIYYNVALHEMGMALKFSKKWDNKDFPFLADEEIYEMLEPIRGFNYQNLLKHTGAISLDPFGIAIEHFFIAPERFKQEIPSLYGALQRALNQDPTKPFGPVLGSIQIIKK